MRHQHLLSLPSFPTSYSHPSSSLTLFSSLFLCSSPLCSSEVKEVPLDAESYPMALWGLNPLQSLTYSTFPSLPLQSSLTVSFSSVIDIVSSALFHWQYSKNQESLRFHRELQCSNAAYQEAESVIKRLQVELNNTSNIQAAQQQEAAENSQRWHAVVEEKEREVALHKDQANKYKALYAKLAAEHKFCPVISSSSLHHLQQPISFEKGRRGSASRPDSASASPLHDAHITRQPPASASHSFTHRTSPHRHSLPYARLPLSQHTSSSHPLDNAAKRGDAGSVGSGGSGLFTRYRQKGREEGERRQVTEGNGRSGGSRLPLHQVPAEQSGIANSSQPSHRQQPGKETSRKRKDRP